MKRIRWILGLCIGGIFSCTTSDQDLSTNTQKPNLLVVLSDQHSYDMLGCYGNPQIKTPHLDQFASEGVRFDNCFTNQPVCTPFRAMFMSGRHPLKNGAFVNDYPLIPNPSLLSEVLKEAGYQTAYIGKWHLLGGNRDRPIPEEMRYGFDQVLTNNCHVDFRPGKCFFWNEAGEKEYFDTWEVNGQTQQALAYLDQVDKDKPFALIVSWHPPHDWGKFKGEDGEMHYRYETMEDLMALYDRDTLLVRPDRQSTPDLRRMYHGYMAMVSGVDLAFGQLMAKLDELGVTDNTLTLFSADHGDMLESHQATLPKQTVHDYSARIPFIVKFPRKIKESYTSHLLISALDMMPTTLGLLGIETEYDYDGQDLSNAILQRREDEVDFIPVWNYQRTANVHRNSSWRGVITKDYSFSMTDPNSDLQLADRLLSLSNVLYDRRKDPAQLHNQFSNPAYQAKKDSLQQLTYRWMKHYQDPFLSGADFEQLKPEKEWIAQPTVSPFELLTESALPQQNLH